MNPSPREALTARALDALRASVSSLKDSLADRSKAWESVAGLVPGLGRPVRDHVRDIRAVNAWLALSRAVSGKRATLKRASPLRFTPSSTPQGQGGKRVCRICKGPWPHDTPALRSRHGYCMRLWATRKNRWTKYPDPADRRAQTQRARATVVAGQQDRRIAALRAADPVRTEHLLRTQGRDAVLSHFASLHLGLRRRLLRAVPPPPKRRYKGELLVRRGLRAERPRKGTP